MRVLDLFCGAGGMSLGFEEDGRFLTVAAAEASPVTAGTFILNHPGAWTLRGDVRDIRAADLAALRPDLVIGGPPCQGFSSIRPRRSGGVEDGRNGLLLDFASAVGAAGPKWFVMENVPGLVTHRGGEALAGLLARFAGIGYTANWKLLDAADFGAPQSRRRLVVVGSREGGRFGFPRPTHGPGRRKRVTVRDAIWDLEPIAAGQSGGGYLQGPAHTPYARRLRGRRRFPGMHDATAHSQRVMRIIRHSGRSIRSIPDGMASGFSTSYSRIGADAPSPTITRNFGFAGSNRCIHPAQDRALTPREAARLQGFPDSYVFMGNRGEVAGQIGDAVPPPLARAVARALDRQW